MAYTGTPNKRSYRKYPTGYRTGSGVGARRIPSGLSAYEELGASSPQSYCGEKYGVTSKDFQPCVDFYKAGKAGPDGSFDYHPAPSDGSSPGFGTQVLNNLMAMFTHPPPAQPRYAPPPAQSGMSQNTMIALGLGAVGLIAVVMMARK